MGNTSAKIDCPGAPLTNAGSIRLLTILNSDREEDPIECSLASVNLGTRPKFSALSYTWGPALHSFAEPTERFPSRKLNLCDSCEWTAIYRHRGFVRRSSTAEAIPYDRFVVGRYNLH
jgi:hypothetical protein